jgi:hypothetical protein
MRDSLFVLIEELPWRCAAELPIAAGWPVMATRQQGILRQEILRQRILRKSIDRSGRNRALACGDAISLA